MKLKVYGGKTEEQIELSSVISETKANEALISQVVRTHLANIRQSNAHTKNRGEVSGGGRKPFRQKGTGRARAGSTRSPLWIGGGVTFGPRNIENYHQRVPQKMATKAIRMILAEKARGQKLVIAKSLELSKVGTKLMQSFLEKLPIEEGSILVVLPKTNANLELSSANLKYIKTVQFSGMKLLDLLKFDYLLTDVEGLKAIEERYGKKAKEA